jgi:hypothetical protein
MGIKIKNRAPRLTDFKNDDLVININEGTIYYKSKNKLYKLQGDDLGTTTTEISPVGNIEFSKTSDGRSNNIKFDGQVEVKGDLIPAATETYDLGSSTKIWKDLHVMDESIKFYKTGGEEIGKIQFEEDKGLKVRDKEGNTKEIIGNVDGGSF